jgi:protein-tyrosine-phosphatase/predicted ATP-grasp superfamily ATP-dependent carboligase
MATRGHVLVLDGDKIPALDIVRSLGRAGLIVSVASSRPDALAFKSRYAHRALIYPHPEPDYEPFVTWLDAVLRTDAYDLVVPVTDLTVVPIAKNFDRLRRRAALATESFDRLHIVSDKSKTVDLARRVGVPCPATLVVHDAADVDRHVASLTFPVVCKPMMSSVWSGGRFVSVPVSYAFNEADLRRQLAECLPDCPVMLQEYRKGTGVGVEVLARNGEILQAFQHERLHELPLTGGGSTYRKSVAVDPRLRDYAARLIAELGWTGVAMVEFRADAGTGDVSLMEINGRFWGSLPLSSRAGMTFVADLYRMLVLGEKPAQRSYTTGIRCRKLAADVEWFKEALTLDPEHLHVRAGLIRKPSPKALVTDLARMFLPTERFDVQTLSDPLPGLIDLRQAIAAQLPLARRTVKRAAMRAFSAGYRARNRARLARAVRGAENVLFVCFGNILRSPFASSYFRLKAASSQCGVTARSTGIWHRTNRPADPRGVAIGRHWEVDLSSHRSTRIDEEMVAWADVIFVMDRGNLRALRERFPSAGRKTFLLGTFDPQSSDVEIADPYSGDEALTERAYAQIVRAIDGLFASEGRVRPHDTTRIKVLSRPVNGV